MQKRSKIGLLIGSIVIILILIPLLVIFLNKKKKVATPWGKIKYHAHVNHKVFYKNKKFSTPQEVTKSCLSCHKDAAKEVMMTQHWNWVGDPVKVRKHKGKMRIGKKNILNNFCLGIHGNWDHCTVCHAGYGWKDETFDFKKQANVDCLVCHDWSGTYVKGRAGMPVKSVNLSTVAGSVGYPKRENCGICHFYGGGGMGVKHGDLDNSLVNPLPTTDVHMGKDNLLCIDCHKTDKHKISGKAFSVSVNHEDGIGCLNCHAAHKHKDPRIEKHLSSVACETCHIPRFAKIAPTKMIWEWSKAGNPNIPNDPHHYLKIKGLFKYEKNIIPKYYWFRHEVDRYILGDKIDPSKPTPLNKPVGNIKDSLAKIYPFKVHRANQPYDKIYNYILLPMLSGKGGYWREFNWQKALRLGAKGVGMKYSGKFGFAWTDMYWPLSHMVSPSNKALKCNDCHSNKSRLNWKALGYEGDPIEYGGREENGLIKKGGKK